MADTPERIMSFEVSGNLLKITVDRSGTQDVLQLSVNEPALLSYLVANIVKQNGSIINFGTSDPTSSTTGIVYLKIES